MASAGAGDGPADAAGDSGRLCQGDVPAGLARVIETALSCLGVTCHLQLALALGVEAIALLFELAASAPHAEAMLRLELRLPAVKLVVDPPLRRAEAAGLG